MALYSLRFLFQALYFRKVMTTLTMKNNPENHHNQFVSILSNEPKKFEFLILSYLQTQNLQQYKKV